MVERHELRRNFLVRVIAPYLKQFDDLRFRRLSSCGRIRRKKWCGRWESNPHEEKSPEDFHAVYGFRRPDADALQHSRPVCGLDYPFAMRRIVPASLKLRRTSPGVSGAARLVSTPSRLVAPGLARDCHLKGFPEFEQFCIAGFPASTQVFLKSAAYAIPPRPRAAVLTSSIL